MNRIILIGNGFDKAHDMPTSYNDFINAYYKGFCEKASEQQRYYKNEDLEMSVDTQTIAHVFGGRKVNSIDEFYSYCKSYNQLQKSNYPPNKVDVNFYNKFLEHITLEVKSSDWVDVENEFYLHLIEAAKTEINHTHITKMPEYIDVNTLNQNLDSISKILEKYLDSVEKKHLSNPYIQQIQNAIYSKFNYRDISLSFIDVFLEEVKSKMEYLKDKNTDLNSQRMITEYSQLYPSLSFNTKVISVFSEQNSLLNYNKESLNQEFKNGFLSDYFMVPENILFLTFNYTHTEQKYVISSPLVDVIHIHGEIDNKENPIIFGYGDELEKNYKTIENLNDNRFLKNMKSTHYFRTENYRKLLSFIESQPYQIFIMGHSCGNSDRTLLNTLFEHKNCASIKPFFHQIDENKDNYNEIIQNISRNFNDKIMMRDRVVNKTFCEPLVKII